jgi:thiol-disulfide isomerase/thioredoxin
MKISVTACLLFIGIYSSAQVKKFTVNGTVPATAKKYIVQLSWNNGGAVEEAKVINGKFTIKGELTGPSPATLSLQEVNPVSSKPFSRLEFEQNTCNLFLDGGSITVSTKTFLWDAVVKGPAVTNDYQAYQLQIKKLSLLESKMGEVYDAYRKEKNKEAYEKVFSIYEGMRELYYMEQLAFVKTHPSSPISVYFTKLALGVNADAAKGEPMFLLLSHEVQNSEEGKEISTQISIGRRSMVGVAATDFTQPDPEGKPISLSSFKGKYVLVDFWASWCGPCRAESPNLVKAYEKYKTRNFEIFSVSFDEKKDKWLRAVKEDKFSWAQAGDMKGADNEAGVLYGIMSIPFNILLNPEGMIIARDLRGEELDKKLADLLR